MSTSFFGNGSAFLRETGEIKIEIPALPRPTISEVREYYRYGHETVIKRDTSPEEPLIMTLGTILECTVIVPPTMEERLLQVIMDTNDGPVMGIDGAEYQRRLEFHKETLLGFQHMLWVMEKTILPKALARAGVGYVEFPGLLMADKEQLLTIPAILCKGRKEWKSTSTFVDDGFGPHGRIAVMCRK